MIIKTITCHNVYNYGASLQAYALQAYLEHFGHDVEIIDFQPYYHQNRYNIGYVPQESKYYSLLQKLPFLKYLYAAIKQRSMFRTWGRKTKFDNFTKNYLYLTADRYETSEALKTNAPSADIYIAGSDQIWNTDSENGREPAYYLDFGSKVTRRISYAASFAVSSIKQHLKTFVKAEIEKLDVVSVREATGIKLLQELGLEGTQVVDPVFLLSKEQWSDIASKAKDYKLQTNKYILVYDFMLDERIQEFVYKLKEELKIPIVSVNDFNIIGYADININDAGPLEFLYLIKNAHTVVSSSFHATSFSIIFEKEFYVFPLKGQNNSSRMEDLLNKLGLCSRFCSTNMINSHIEYRSVNEVLKQQIYDSKCFLLNAVK